MAEKAYEIVDNVALHSKRGKSQEAEQRHLEELEFIKEGDRVYPFGCCPEIPELPQHAADKSCAQKQAGPSECPSFPVSQKGMSPSIEIDGLKQQGKRAPGEGKAVAGKKEYCSEAEAPQGKEEQVYPSAEHPRSNTVLPKESQ